VVDTTARPSLIDLVNKLEKERKNWFYKILSPLSKGLRIPLGKSPISTVELISNSLKFASDIAIEGVDQLRKIETTKHESGLAYLLELHKTIYKS
jgi:hypothetical protein